MRTEVERTHISGEEFKKLVTTEINGYIVKRYIHRYLNVRVRGKLILQYDKKVCEVFGNSYHSVDIEVHNSDNGIITYMINQGCARFTLECAEEHITKLQKAIDTVKQLQQTNWDEVPVIIYELR